MNLSFDALRPLFSHSLPVVVKWNFRGFAGKRVKKQSQTLSKQTAAVGSKNNDQQQLDLLH